ncbi:MAG TPA: hypothetical protein VJY54_02910 [Lachnospiraceae bacterium]|nr:hypothetical protein [Lachnospiraceae bacterium]
MFLNDIEYPNQILDAIKEDKLVVFAGDGVSVDSPTCLPDFNKMAEQISAGTGLVRSKGTSCEVFLGNL